MVNGINNKLDNEDLLVEKAKYDDAFFEVLYEHYLPLIYGFIYKRCGSKEESEDIVSKTFMKVFCNLKDFNSKKGSFSSWVYKIANNNLIDYYRKQGRKKEIHIDRLENEEGIGFNLENNIDSFFSAEITQKAISELNTKYQNILQLKYFAELTNEEISSIMNISVNNTRVIIHRALKKFAVIYKKYEK